MRVDWIEIQNYRKFEKILISMDKDLTVLAGANNTGKTSLITLLSQIFTTKRDYSINDASIKMILDWWKSSKDGIVNLLNKGVDNASLYYPFLLENLTIVKFKIDYDPVKDIISNFANYIMDLDDDKYSFYFIVNFSINRTKFAEEVVNKKEMLKRKKNEDLLQSFIDLARSYVEMHVSFTDENFNVSSPISSNTEFRKLFNFTYIEAARKIDDIETDKNNSISKIALDLVKKDKKWKSNFDKLPEDILNVFAKHQLQSTIESLSLTSLKSVIKTIEDTNGSGTTSLTMSPQITQENIQTYLNEAIKARYKIDEFYLEESSQGLGYSNMIYLILKLEEAQQKVDPLKVNILVVEEPESHMHPQMQSEFFKSLKKYYQSKNIYKVS